MLVIKIPETEFWDESNQAFVSVKEQTLELEHSLVSLSKWESKWKKPFISKEPKTSEETIDYIKCMTLNRNIDPKVYYCIGNNEITKINEYMQDSMTATTFNEEKRGKSNREQLTAEVIFYYMTAFNIPFECKKWHLNQLMTLIKVCAVKNQPDKKMKNRDILKSNAALNAARRKQYNTKG